MENKYNSSNFRIFERNANEKFRNSKHPNDLLKDLSLMFDMELWYFAIFAKTLTVTGCGVCLYEKFKEMTNLTDMQIDNRVNLRKLIKENVVIWHKNTPYSRKSPHLTNELMEEIAELHPGKVEDNPVFVELPIKKKRTKIIIENGNDNQG